MKVASFLLFGLLLFASVVPSVLADDSTTGALIEILHTKGVIDDASYQEIKKAGGEGGAASEQTTLLDVLYKKGVLDEASYNKLRAQAASEQKATVAQAAPGAPQASATSEKPGGAQRPLETALSAAEDSISKLTGGAAKPKLGFFFQGGWLSDSASFSVPVPPTTNISLTSRNQFFVRRARPSLAFEITPKLGLNFSAEFAPTSSILRDAYLWTSYIPYATLSLGQLKQPFSLENVEALSDNPAINRSLVSNMVVNASLKDTGGTKNPVLRDLGGTISGKFQNSVAGLPVGATYAIGVFNGTGYFNNPDDNNRKDIVGRLTINPLIEGLNVGGSFAAGMTHQQESAVKNNTYSGTTLVPPTPGTEGLNKPRDRWGAEFDYTPQAVKGLKVRGEFISDRRYFDSYVSTNMTNTSLPTALPLNFPALLATTTGQKNYKLWNFNRLAHAEGWYLLASYKVDGLKDGLRYLNGFEPVFRFDTLDENTAKGDWFVKIAGKLTRVDVNRDNSRYRFTVGMNYYLNKYTRLMVDYEMIHADGGLKLKSLEPIDTISHNLFTTLMQVKF